MATYKVIQDIEADDKLLGPLSLKQFIYVAIAMICLYLTFFAATKGAAFMGVILLPPAAFFGILGFPWSKSQPTEVWLLAKVRFFFKPRKRIWDQSGSKQLVTITVPKQVERNYTNGLNQRQVQSRLSALAQTVDSRGWAVKQLQSAPFGPDTGGSDRLTAGTTIPQETIPEDVLAQDDMLDEQNNATAQRMNQMMNQSAAEHKQQLINKLQSPSAQQQNPNTGAATEQPSNDFWFMSENTQTPLPAGTTTGSSTVIAPHSEPEHANYQTPEPEQAISPDAEAELLAKIHAKQALHPTRRSRQATILPLSEQQNLQQEQPQSTSATKPPETPRTEAPNPAIIGLANNDDLSIETIAHQANKKNDDPPDEVVISLH